MSSENKVIVILSLTENNNTLTREVPYGFATKFLGTGFRPGVKPQARSQPRA